MIFNQMMSLPASTERAATLLIDERVLDCVGSVIRYPSKRKCQELLAVLLCLRVRALSHLPCASDQARWDRSRPTIVYHVTPDKSLVVCPRTHFERKPAENVTLGNDFLFGQDDQVILENFESITKLEIEASSGVVEYLPGFVKKGPDY